MSILSQGPCVADGPWTERPFVVRGRSSAGNPLWFAVVDVGRVVFGQDVLNGHCPSQLDVVQMQRLSSACIYYPSNEHVIGTTIGAVNKACVL